MIKLLLNYNGWLGFDRFFFLYFLHEKKQIISILKYGGKKVQFAKLKFTSKPRV